MGLAGDESILGLIYSKFDRQRYGAHRGLAARDGDDAVLGVRDVLPLLRHLDARARLLRPVCGVQGSGCRVWGLGFRVGNI